MELLNGGVTVPLIVRYREKATDGLDDIQLGDDWGLAIVVGL